MLDAFVGGLALVLTAKTLGFMMLGVLLGFWVGLLPGLGGMTTLALMLAFIYPMSPPDAFAFLLGMHSVTATTGDITSILFGVPGEAISAATVLDGHPMATKGEAGRALGAALMSSLVGAVIGAAALALAIPVVRPLVLAFGSPELFMLAVMGLGFIVSLSGRGWRGLARGFLAAALGLFCSTIGQDPQGGVLRFTLGTLYLWEGLDLVPVMVGLFAIPEVIDLACRGTAIAGTTVPQRLAVGVLEGVKDTFRHWGLTVRCSLIGAFIGVIPGLGGGVAQWLAYGHAVQSAPAAERGGFGRGDVRGVLGPGAANNSKEGGSLIPTVAFGVPGSASMALLLAAFTLMGLVPGPDMLTKHLTLTFSMVWTIILANVVSVALSLLFLSHLVRLTTVRGGLIIPFVLLLTFIGGFTANNSLGDLVVTVVFGALGYLMVLFGWPRPPFVLGLVLGKIAEDYLFISTSRYGAEWLSRPMVVLIGALTLVAIVYPALQARWAARRAGHAA